jgi:hypothetical protein
LEEWEKQAIVGFHLKNPLEGYRRLTFMMLDADIVAVSPASVWRVLGQAGLLRKWNGKPSKKGTGFQQPPAPHQHWHIDVSYINIAGTFYYLCSVLDGFSRFIVHWDLRPAMTEGDIEIILQAAREQYPEAKPRIISDNGPQFIARDFKGDAQLAHPSVRLRDLHPFHRLRLIGPLQQLFPNGWPMLLQVPWQLLDGHPIHASAPFVGLDSFQRLLAVFPLADFLHQPFGDGRALGPALPRGRFGPFREALRGFTPVLLQEGQH